MRIKRIFALVLSLALLFTSAYAFDLNNVYKGFKLYTGTVWLLDSEDNTVILQNVRIKNKYGKEEFVPGLEYKKISILPQNIFNKEGKTLSFEEVNSYLLDSRVVFVAAANSYVNKVLYMEIQ